MADRKMIQLEMLCEGLEFRNGKMVSVFTAARQENVRQAG